ncbi:serine-type peptidase [Aureococcus anophagefferens]|nr:serine-type peptidase [Aureococcus anophagefferens]
MRLLLLAAAAQALAAPKTGAYQRTSSTTKNIISTLTKVVNLQGGRGEADLAPRARQFDTLSGAAVKEGLAVDFGNEYLWSGKITPELYDEDCVFTDPTLSRGLRTFEANLANLDFWIESLVPEGRRRVDLFDLALVPGATDRVRAKWRMLGALRLPWGPVLDLNGTTTYTLGGDGGRISSYDETWDMTAGDALGQLLRPGATTRIKEPPFWPGRATGAAPPAPGVTFGAGAPTFVVLPGFGNDKVDYSEPLGLGEECGLVLTKGIFDKDFFVSQTAAADSPAFSWYADAVRATLAGVDGDVVLVGHSAGGWLARAACLDAAVAARVAGVVTLGSLHRPPPGVECATRAVAAVFTPADAGHFGDAYRRRRPSGAGPERVAAAASARASIETLAKRPSLGPETPIDGGRQRRAGGLGPLGRVRALGEPAHHEPPAGVALGSGSLHSPTLSRLRPGRPPASAPGKARPRRPGPAVVDRKGRVKVYDECDGRAFFRPPTSHARRTFWQIKRAVDDRTPRTPPQSRARRIRRKTEMTDRWEGARERCAWGALLPALAAARFAARIGATFAAERARRRDNGAASLLAAWLRFRMLTRHAARYGAVLSKLRAKRSFVEGARRWRRRHAVDRLRHVLLLFRDNNNRLSNMIGRFRRRVRLMQRLVRRWLGCLQARSDILMALWLRAECEIAADAAFHAADAPPGVALEDSVPERSRPRGLGTYLMAVLARHRRAGAAVRGSILPRGEDGLAPSQSILNVRRRLRKSKAKHALEQRKTHSRAHRAHQRRAGVESTISHHTHFWATLNRERRTIALLLAGPACGDAAMKAEVAALMGARRSAFFRRLEASRLAEGTATTQIFGRNEARRPRGRRTGAARPSPRRWASPRCPRRRGHATTAHAACAVAPKFFFYREFLSGHGGAGALRAATRAPRELPAAARRSASRTNIDEGGAIAEILAARGSRPPSSASAAARRGGGGPPRRARGRAPPAGAAAAARVARREAAPDPRRPMPIESPRRPVDPPEDDGRERTGAMLFWTVVVLSALVAIVLILRPVLLREARKPDTTKYYTVGLSVLVDVGVLDAASASLAVDVSSVANPRVLATGSGCAVSYAINGTTLVIAGAANASRTLALRRGRRDHASSPRRKQATRALRATVVVR